MKKVGVLLLLLLLGGCSAGVHSSLLEMESSIDLPFLSGERQQAVVFPDRPARDGRQPLAAAYGSWWRDVQADYPEYRFNP